MLAAGMLLILATANPLTAVPPSMDAGRQYAGQRLSRQFELVNSGDEPLTIVGLRASCGCAAPLIDRKVLPPHSRTVVTLEINTLSQPAGPVRWSVAAEWQAGDQSGRLTWELTAQLVREIELQPAALALAGDPTLSHEIVLTDRRPNPLTITGVRSEAGRVTAEILPDRRIRVRISEQCPAGSHSDHLALSTNDPKYAELRVPVSVHRRGESRFLAVPARVVVTPSGSVLVQIRSADHEPVKIGELKAEHPALTTRWASGPGAFATIRIGLDKSKWDGQPIASEVTATLSGARGEVVRIPVSVRAEE